MIKKLFGILIICVALTNLGFSQTVIKSFVAPGDNGTWGLTWDGQSLWSASISENGSVVYQVDTLGKILSSFNFPYGIVSGLTWDGNYLWIGEALTPNLYKYSKNGEELIKLITSLGDVAGLAWDGTYLWVIDRENLTINQLSSEGGILKSFSIETYDGNPSGLTWNGFSLWLCESFNNQIIQLSSEGDFISSFTGPGTNATEIEWDGKNFWISDIVTDRIYQVQFKVAADTAVAKIAFAPDKWNIQWRNLLEEEEENEDEAENEMRKGKLNAYIGEITLRETTFDVKQILVETVRLNFAVTVAKKEECGGESYTENDQKSQTDNCFLAKILRRRTGFEGSVLKAKFNKFEAIQSLPELIQVGDSVEVTISGMLDNGIYFIGKVKIYVHGPPRTIVEDEDKSSLPKTFKLFGNFPNPFNALTQIKYYLSQDGQVELTVFNLLGKKVIVLVNERQTKGEKIVFWDGRDELGTDVASGIYFYKLVTQNESDFGKMTLLK
ncbi:MAG: hypothetical protein A2145_03620 [candidate division Zixibacteria bacterium RBG_16_40_9]|nr:MAG: hypothetical protein A2145_03620 [candidate division Zixibacteria bacterium RBG_16_40_9]